MANFTPALCNQQQRVLSCNKFKSADDQVRCYYDGTDAEGNVLQQEGKPLGKAQDCEEQILSTQPLAPTDPKYGDAYTMISPWWRTQLHPQSPLMRALGSVRSWKSPNAESWESSQPDLLKAVQTYFRDQYGFAVEQLFVPQTAISRRELISLDMLNEQGVLRNNAQLLAVWKGSFEALLEPAVKGQKTPRNLRADVLEHGLVVQLRHPLHNAELKALLATISADLAPFVSKTAVSLVFGSHLDAEGIYEYNGTQVEYLQGEKVRAAGNAITAADAIKIDVGTLSLDRVFVKVLDGVAAQGAKMLEAADKLRAGNAKIHKIQQQYYVELNNVSSAWMKENFARLKEELAKKYAGEANPVQFSFILPTAVLPILHAGPADADAREQVVNMPINVFAARLWSSHIFSPAGTPAEYLSSQFGAVDKKEMDRFAEQYRPVVSAELCLNGSINHCAVQLYRQELEGYGHQLPKDLMERVWPMSLAVADAPQGSIANDGDYWKNHAVTVGGATTNFASLEEYVRESRHAYSSFQIPVVLESAAANDIAKGINELTSLMLDAARFPAGPRAGREVRFDFVLKGKE